jgi:hypothetical protein
MSECVKTFLLFQEASALKDVVRSRDINIRELEKRVEEGEVAQRRMQDRIGVLERDDTFTIRLAILKDICPNGISVVV